MTAKVEAAKRAKIGQNRPVTAPAPAREEEKETIDDLAKTINDQNDSLLHTLRHELQQERDLRIKARITKVTFVDVSVLKHCLNLKLIDNKLFIFVKTQLDSFKNCIPQ